GTAGQQVTIDMNAIQGGSLDSQLILLTQQGNVIASNDDASDTTRDSQIRATLPQDGTYLILATRFGKNVGGTEGNYQLALGGATSVVSATPAPTLAGQAATQAPAATTPAATLAPNLAGLPAGSIQISLVWNNAADLRLLVRDPELRSLFSDNRTLASGGILAQQDNLNCENTTTSPATYAYWPIDRLPAGTYEIQIWMNNQCNEAIPPNFTLAVSVRGQEVLRVSDRADANRNLYVTSFTVDQAGAATAGEGGLFTGQVGVDLGDISTRVASAEPVAVGRPVAGGIDATNTFNVYTFQARAGDRVRITQRATGGTLDPYLYLLNTSGVQIATNDDINPGIDRNAQITQVIPADGGYIIVATRFGGRYGGTSGTYELSITPGQ
ncbi:MAG: PPC domain-containing protein, partial [Anaerolineae bacterium]|nr:PPC domain-containing protein [Anaerolineae bacterium]